VVEAIRSAKLVYLTTHLHPDGDAVGSELALGEAFQQLGKAVVIANPDRPPPAFHFLPGIHQVAVYREDLPPPDLLVVVDCPDPLRLGAAASLLRRAKAVLNVDHHPTNTRYGTWNVIREKAAAVGEVVYEAVEELREAFHGLPRLNPEMAAGLYTAILTDSGRFGYAATSPDTHRMAAELLRQGLNPQTFVRALYDLTTVPRLKLLGLALGTLSVAQEAPVAWMKVTRQMYEATGTTSEDTEGFVNYPRSIAGVEVAVFIREEASGEVRVSLRAIHDVDVSAIAQSFGGGGHVKAAGCTVRGSLEDVERRVVAAAIAACPR